MHKQKLYCYVDESGQDTKGELFLVAVVIVASHRDMLRRKLKEIERSSGKMTKKWTRATTAQRRKYIEAICFANENELAHTVSWSQYHDTKAYVDLTILSTAKSILSRAKIPYEATVFVDGLARTERHRFAAGLRRLHVKVRKVRGIRDQSDEFIRLADAIAGLVRDVLENDASMKILYKTMERKRIIRQN